MKKDKANRALAGLSMGGIYIHWNNSDMFSSLGVFSSGWMLPLLQNVADKQYKILNENPSKFNPNVKNFGFQWAEKTILLTKTVRL
jgi:hypothetical protein